MPARARGDVDARRPGDVGEILFDLPLQVAAAIVVEQVPLVEGEHECAARLEHEVDDANILLADHLADVEHDDRDLRLLERGTGAQRRVEIGALREVHATTDAGGVDEAPDLAPQLDLLIDGIAGGSGELVDDHALLADGLVEQARLADVRASEDRDATRAADLFFGNGGDFGQHGEDVVE